MKNILRNALFVTGGLAVLALAGCGGSGDPSVTTLNAPGTSRLVFQIEWPGSPTRVIPDETNEIEVVVKTESGEFTKTFPRGTSEVIFDELPAGDATVEARGKIAGGRTIVSATKETILAPHTDNTVELELLALPGWIDEDNWTLGGNVSQDPSEPNTIRITLSAVIEKASGEPLDGLTEENFVVLEDDIQKLPIEVAQASEGGGKLDIMFVLDVTGSMGSEIAGVRSSVINFVQDLKASGQDVQVGATTFSDTTEGFYALSGDVDAFSTWVGGLFASGGGDIPENPLTAMGDAFTGAAWRPDAARVMIVMTDAPMHYAGDGSGFTEWTVDTMGNLLTGSAVVHTISPGGSSRSYDFSGQSGPASSRAAGSYPDAKIMSDLTGGTWRDMPWNGVINLAELGISDAIKRGYIIKFKSKYEDKDRVIRLAAFDETGRQVADQVYPARY